VCGATSANQENFDRLKRLLLERSEALAPLP
jgi:hypothetical protein